jgi:uncharacterized protein with PIN domain
MILYLGTSSLVKLYVDEPFSETIKGWARTAEIVATSRIAYTEMMSALDIRFKKGNLSKEAYDLVAKWFSEDWQHFAKVDFDDYEAGNFINKYDLTRFGAIHLSSAKLIQRAYQKQNLDFETLNKGQFDIDFFFSSADEKLSGAAAAAEGLRVLSLS